MYLKALEIQGFKSFPDRTVLPFGEDITAVVGPNGSGKSNISDAIRWVVGEQSTKNLRGGKMEDVIFGGTEKRKQTGYAQVSLVMDNSERLFDMEETEVMITRKYFRSGDSEYFINKHQVRLRDVNELFMGTGLGKEGYSVIGQGKIDEILSVKSEQRREVFEEAAGIAKYRHQKEDSEKKLNRAQENLLRIEDKITELELQVEPLRNKSETARKFLVFRDELRGLEISLWLTQLEEVQRSKIKLRADHTQGVEEKDKVYQELEALYGKVEAYAQEMLGKSVEMEGLRKDLTLKESEVAEQEANITVLKNNIANNESNAQRLTENLQQKQKREEEFQEQIQDILRQMEELRNRRTSLGQESEGKIALAQQLEKDLTDKNNQLEGIRQEETKKTALISEEKAKLSALTSSTQEIWDQEEGLRKDLLELEGKVKEETNQCEENRREWNEATEGKSTATNEVDGYLLRVEGRQKKVNDLRGQCEQVGRTIYNKESREKMLRDMEKDYDGFHNAVRKVMSASKDGRLKNVHGPVADLVKVSGEFTVAIETALGGGMQNIVVDSSRDGKSVIEFLKQQRGGRVTCLPLDTMKPRYLNQINNLQKEDGFVGVASSLLQFDPKYRTVMENLLGNVAVMENLDCAIVTARKFQHQFRIVTLDGQVLNQGGSMTGGDTNKSAGILSRKDEMDRIKGEVQELRIQLGELEQEMGDINTQMSGDQYQLSIAQNKLRSCEDGILKWEGAVTASEGSLRLLTEQLQQKQSQLSFLDQRNESIVKSTEEAQVFIQEQEAELEGFRQQYQGQLEALHKLQEEWTEAKDLATKFTSQLQILDNEEQSLQQNKGNVEQFLKDMEGERSDNSAEIASITAKNQEFARYVSDKEGEIATGRKESTDIQEKIQAVEVERRQMEATRVQMEKDTRTINAHLNTLERNVVALEQKANNAESEEAHILGKLWESYELVHEAAKAQQVPIESTVKATRRISELKRDISSLGNIDIDAIEEFEKINERYTYLTDQRDDISSAKAELEKIIAEIVKEMEGIFATEFARINEAFGEIFVKLFGGGRAEVFLENTADVLGAGIEIKAQPPGKALKTLSLLSGGEKALVAISLYFAILRIRPSPFVVMDEIEAALDDSNIERFVEYLRQVSDKTQFIIITHRRGSMEAADVLYGITMQEKGVSRMLRLNLNDVERELNIQLT